MALATVSAHIRKLHCDKNMAVLWAALGVMPVRPSVRPSVTYGLRLEDENAQKNKQKTL